MIIVTFTRLDIESFDDDNDDDDDDDNGDDDDWWSMMNDVWWRMNDVWCMMSGVWCMMYDVAWCCKMLMLVLLLLMMMKKKNDVWCMMYDYGGGGGRGDPNRTGHGPAVPRTLGAAATARYACLACWAPPATANEPSRGWMGFMWVQSGLSLLCFQI